MYKIGDLIIGKINSNRNVIRRIKKCLVDGTYIWEYPDLPTSEKNEFWSGNSTDPNLIFYKLWDGKVKTK